MLSTNTVREARNSFLVTYSIRAKREIFFLRLTVFARNCFLLHREESQIAILPILPILLKKGDLLKLGVLRISEFSINPTIFGHIRNLPAILQVEVVLWPPKDGE